jgi:arylsulfatase A-like enzyme
MTNRREFLKTASCSWSVFPTGGVRPNVLILMTDQQRAGFTRASGFPLDTMPALDCLAAGGVRFERAYCTAPACGPSRVSLMTGRWPHAHRVRENGGLKHAYFEKDLVDVLRPMGYRIGLAGKNDSHVRAESCDFFRPYSHSEGWKPANAPAEFTAIDKWLAGLHSHASLEPAPFPPEVQYPYRIVSDAVDFLNHTGTQPFALWVSIPEPHPPYQASKPYFDLFPPESVPARAAGPEALAAKGFKWRWMADAIEATHPGYDRQWRRNRDCAELVSRVRRRAHHIQRWRAQRETYQER